MTIDTALFTQHALQNTSDSQKTLKARAQNVPEKPGNDNRTQSFEAALKNSSSALSPTKPSQDGPENLIKVNVDMNDDGVVDAADLNMQLANFGGKDMSYDHNQDGRVDGKDLDILLAFWGTEGDMVTASPDLNNDGTVDTNDLNQMLANFGSEDSIYDLNNDGINDENDLNVLLSFWGNTQTA